MPDSPTLRFQRKRKRWPFVVAILVVLVIIAWQVIERTVDVDSYRPMLIEKITKNTGLPVSIGLVDLALFPVPNVRAHDVTVGDGDFKAVCSQLSAQAQLSSLVRGVIDVSELSISDLVVVLPKTPGELKTRVDAMVTAYEDNAATNATNKTNSGRISFAIGRIDAPDASITLEGADRPVFSGALAATNVLSKIITIIGDAASPAYGEDARIAGTITLDRNGVEGVGLGVTGDIDLTTIDTAALFAAERVPRAIATAHGTIERTEPSQYRIDVSGNAQPVENGGVDLSAIAGDFSGVGWWDSGQITLNGLTWSAPGVELTTDITVQPDGGVAVSIKEVTANVDGVQALLSAQPSDDYRVTATDEAQILGSGLLIGVTADKKLRLAGGTATFSGVNLSLPGGADAITGITGEIAFEKDAIRITSLDAAGLSVKGTVLPNFSDATAVIDLGGRIELTRERLGMFMPLDVVKQAKGTVTLDHVTGTFGSGGDVPDDLSITGKLADGSFDIESEAWSDSLRGVSADFKATPGVIDTTASADTSKLGAVSIKGKYAIGERNWTGTARGNLGNINLPFLKQEAAKNVAPGILEAFGDSNFTLNLDLPTEKAKRLLIAFARDGAPKLEGDVVMLSRGSGWELGDVNVYATIPGNAFQPMLPATMHVSGLVPIDFVRTTEPAVFEAMIELSGNTVELSEYLTKREGIAASMKINGIASTGNWAAKTVLISCLDQSISGKFTEARFEVPQFDISAALMPDGAQAGGRIRGNFATQPVTANVELDQVNFALNDQLGVDFLDGGVTYNDGAIATKNLAVRGANSDFTIDLVSRESGWSGALTGKQLDVNAMLAMRTALASQSAAGTPGGDSAPETGGGFNGTFDINMGTVLVKKGQLNNVFTNVKAVNGDIEIGNLTFANREGTGSGWVRFGQARGAQRAYTAMNLKLDGVDQALLDDLVFDEPRGLQGPMWGTVELEVPSGETLPLLSGTTGAVKLTSTDGTFGKLGIATKVLSVLRTLEITRLRAPKLKDQGLAYDTCEMEATFNDGVMTMSTLNLKTPSYVITALGGIDFNAQQTDILVHVDLLEMVLGPADNIPGLNDVVGAFRNTGGFRILLTGSPIDPDTNYGFGPKPGSITDDVRNSVKGGGNIVRDEILNRATDALKGILNKN